MGEGRVRGKDSAREGERGRRREREGGRQSNAGITVSVGR